MRIASTNGSYGRLPARSVAWRTPKRHRAGPGSRRRLNCDRQRSRLGRVEIRLWNDRGSGRQRVAGPYAGASRLKARRRGADLATALPRRSERWVRRAACRTEDAAIRVRDASVDSGDSRNPPEHNGSVARDGVRTVTSAIRRVPAGQGPDRRRTSGWIERRSWAGHKSAPASGPCRMVRYVG